MKGEEEQKGGGGRGGEGRKRGGKEGGWEGEEKTKSIVTMIMSWTVETLACERFI